MAGRVFEIFVGDIKETWKDSIVLAKDIMMNAGKTDTTKLLLEALDRKNGHAIKEFTPDQEINLEEKDRTFFRITPEGGGYS